MSTGSACLKLIISVASATALRLAVPPAPVLFINSKTSRSAFIMSMKASFLLASTPHASPSMLTLNLVFSILPVYSKPDVVSTLTR